MGNGNHWCISKIKSRKKLVVKFKNWKAAIIIYIAFFMTPSIHDFNHLTRQRVRLSLNPSSWLCVEINSRTQHIPERPIWCLLQKKTTINQSHTKRERYVWTSKRSLLSIVRQICNHQLTKFKYATIIINLSLICCQFPPLPSPLSPLPECVNTHIHTKK